MRRFATIIRKIFFTRHLISRYSNLKMSNLTGKGGKSNMKKDYIPGMSNQKTQEQLKVESMQQQEQGLHEGAIAGKTQIGDSQITNNPGLGQGAGSVGGGVTGNVADAQSKTVPHGLSL